MFDQPTPETTRRVSAPGRPIRLADGAEWYFLRPSTRLSPKVVVETDPFGGRVERVAIDITFGYPMRIESLIAGLNHACEHGGVMEQYEAFFSLAAELVVQAHDISPQAVCVLLRVDEEGLPQLVSEVISLISEPGNAIASNAPEVSRREPI